MRYPNFLILVMLAILGMHVNTQAQDIEDFVAKYTSENGEGYMQPFANAFGANLNSGLFSNAYIPENGFRLQVGLVAMTTIVKDRDRTFTATTDDFFTPQTSIEASTVFGSTEGVSVEGDGGTVYNFPGGLSVDMLPLAVPQVTLGAIKGTELLVRFFASDIGEDVGQLNLLGLGIRHSIDQYLPEAFPVSLAVGYYWQKLTLEDFVDSKNSFISAQASFRKGPLILYGGPGYELSSLEVTYTFESGDNSEDIQLDLDSDNSLRFTAGVGLQLGSLYLNTDYNLGDQNVWSAGLGIIFGKNKE
ncbi:MAG: DUF6588 family protein [Bacteroidota bacterium]